MHIINGFGLVLVATNEGKIYLFKIGYFGLDIQI
jgi:hypothetical protein